MRSLLTKGSLTLRDTFLTLLYATVQVGPKGNEVDLVDESSLKKAFDILQASQFEDPKNRAVPVNLIYLQCMTLAILESDQRGPESLRGKNGVPSKTQLLQMAVALGYSLVKQFNLEAPRQVDGDRDSVKNLIRRNWIILVVLDRFHALSTGGMKLVSNTMSKFHIVDKSILGDTLFYLTGKFM